MAGDPPVVPHATETDPAAPSRDAPDDGHPEALHPVIDTALTALDEALDLLQAAAADGAEVGPLAAELARVAERLAGAAEAHADSAAAAAADPDAALTEPGALLAAARACLEAAGESLDEAVALADDGGSGLDPAVGRALLRAGNRLRDAGASLADAARDAAQWALDLDRAPADDGPTAELPLTVTDRIVATPLGPRAVHVYWSLTPGGIDRAQAALPAGATGRPTLRLYRAGGDPGGLHDRPLDDWIGHLDLRVEHPGGRLVCALGLAAESGFVHIARAVPVQLPPVAPEGGGIRFTRVEWGPTGTARVTEADHAGPEPRLAAASTPRPARDLSRVMCPTLDDAAEESAR